MNTTQIRITMRNNTDARRADILGDIGSASVRHNGGKLVIATVDASDLDAAKELLDASNAVASYEVRA